MNSPILITVAVTDTKGVEHTVNSGEIKYFGGGEIVSRKNPRIKSNSQDIEVTPAELNRIGRILFPDHFV